MKLDHLMRAYKYFKIESKLDEEEGIINFGKGIKAAYLLDKDRTVTCLKICINANLESRTDEEQLEYSIQVLSIMQQSIMLLGNTGKKECNMILRGLGVFDGTYGEGKQIRHIDHEYKVEVISGLIMLSIVEA